MSETEVDDPIEPHGDDEGNVIDLAGVKIQWGRSKTKWRDRCEHKHLIYDQSERRVWCEDCSRTIDAFDALLTVVKYFREMDNTARSRYRKATEAFNSSARLRATKALDREWSGNVMAVACPHCRGGLLPEDFANGASSAWARELEIAKRKKSREDA